MEMKEEFSRTAALLGTGAIGRLKAATVAVFGIGGVGGYVCEALARAGVGGLDLFDRDTVSLSNINRQVIALHSTVGKGKADAMRDRILDINPDCRVRTFSVFYLPENADAYPLEGYDYIVDAIDTVSAKIELAVRAQKAGVPLICAMGAGNKLNPELFTVTDLAKTHGCPLARVMRRELKARGILHQKVVFSPEEAVARPADAPDVEVVAGKQVPGSVSFVPAVAGLMMAGEVIKDLIGAPFFPKKGEGAEDQPPFRIRK